VLVTTGAGAAIVAAAILFTRNSLYLAVGSLAVATAMIIVFWVIVARPSVRQDKTASDEIGRERLDADLLYDFANSRLELQKGAIDSIDAKVGVIFSVGSAEIGALAAFLALNSHPKPGVPLVLAASFASYFVLAGISARVLWSRNWVQGPRMAEVVEAYRTLDKSVVKLGVAESMIKAFDDNVDAAADKSLGLKIVIVALIVQTLGLVASVPLVT
jgi:hypothetical protein